MIPSKSHNSTHTYSSFNLVIRSKGNLGIELRDLYRQMHITARGAGRQVAQELVKAGLVVEALINGAEAYTAIEYLPTD